MMSKKNIVSMALLLVSFAITLPAAAQEQPLPDIGSYSQDALSARLTALRDLYRIKLSDMEKASVVEHCQSAQAGLRKISTKTSATKSERAETYNAVVSLLTGLRALVVAKQVDPSNIELLTVEYQQSVEQFNLAITDYQIALEDSVQVDCRAKPEEFRAALEGVRATRKQVVAASAQINEVTKSNLKTAFDTLKDRLSAEEQINGKQ